MSRKKGEMKNEKRARAKSIDNPVMCPFVSVVLVLDMRYS
jgi:hypothetical protein